MTRTESTTELMHLTPDTYKVIGSEAFGAPGLVARESVGPAASVQAVGPILMIHDSTFEAHRGIGHHPHQGMERLFYILEGAVDHDDALNHITGHMGTGDLGILTEGRRGMIHSEWNHTDGRARAYIFVYPTDPLPATASFDAVRAEEVTRTRPAAGVDTKEVISRDSARLHGDLRVLGDSRVEEGAVLDVAIGVDEAAVLFVVDGEVDVDADTGSAEGVGVESTVLFAPVPEPRTVRVTAASASRVLYALTGRGSGLVRR